MTGSSSSVVPETEEEALEALADQMFSTSRCDFTPGTFHGNPSYFAHGYSQYSSSEADQFQKEMFGDIHSYSYTWTQSTLMVTATTMKSGLVNAFVPHIYDALLGVEGKLGPTEEPIATPEIFDPDLEVTLCPNHFKQLDDEVEITIRLKNELGEDAADEKITLENMDDGSVLSAITNSNGRTTFIVEHTVPDKKMYRYKISGMQTSKTVEIPVLTAGIELEINPATEQPYIGVMAHGYNYLEMNIDFSEFRNGSLKLTQPALGEVEGDALNLWGGVSLDDGIATLKYVPPKYLDYSDLTREDDSLGFKAIDVVGFTLTDEDGNDTLYEVKIDVYRPPVVLVHGFTGNATTWQVLDHRLTDQKYHTIREEYYYGDHSIESQAWALDTDITDRLILFLARGIKADKVDVVAHSMGGLITRYYVNDASYYNDNVRKLIMVGTPNHGCTWTDKQFGIFQSLLIGKHRLAALQLAEDSFFMSQLNRGENTGVHLNPMVQYGVIYSYSAKPWFFGGDMVVSATSARLNGIMNVSVRDMTHSGVFRSLGAPITESSVPFTRIESWLQEDIYRPALKNTQVERVSLEGKVTVKTWVGDKRVESIIYESAVADGPYKLNAHDDIITGDGKVVIRISINGTPIGFINIDKNTHIRIGNSSLKHIDVKMLAGRARYITFDSSGMHFIVELVTKNGDWQTVTGLNTDFGISLSDPTNVVVMEGGVNVSAENDNDEINQMTLEEDEAASIDSTGEISEMDARDFPDAFWENEFYKIPKTTVVLAKIANIKDKMIVKSQSMGYSIYLILAVILMLVLMMLKSRRCKWLFGLLLACTSAVSVFILYYIATDISLLLFSRIDNLLASLKNSILMAGGGVILIMILLSGLFSVVTGKRRDQRRLRDGNDGFDYDGDYDDD